MTDGAPLPITLVATTRRWSRSTTSPPPFQLTVREEAFGAITVTYKGKTIVLTPDQALASVSGRLVSLPAPTARSGRRWFVPVEFISRALSLIYDARLELRKPSRLLIVGDLRVPRITLRYDPLGASGRLTIDATPRALATVTQEADHLTIKFEADAIDVANPPLPEPNSKDLLQGVRVVDATTLAVDLGPRFSSFRATSQPVDTTARLVIDLLAQTETAAQPPAPPGATPPGATPPPATPPPPAPPELPPAFGQSSSAIHTVAIDPGHGGDDAGVKGANGAIEKDVTLAIARRVKGVIEARLGLRVLLTRDDDRNVPLDERTAIANNNKADLFISLHANASLRKATSGATIFTAAFERDAAANATAGGADRLPTFGGGARDIELVLVGPGADAPPRSVGGLRRHARAADARPGAAGRAGPRPRRAARARIGEHAGRPDRGRLPDEPGAGNADQDRRVPELRRPVGLRRGRPVPRLAPRPEARDERRAPDGRHRRAASASSPWAPCSRSSCGAALERPRDDEHDRQRGDAAARRTRRRRDARSRRGCSTSPTDGTKLTSVERDVAFGEGAVEQAREIIVGADRAGGRAAGVGGAGRARRCARCSSPRAARPTSICRREVVAAHPGGTLNEMLSIYTLVNALTENLPAVTAVQVLVDGKEVETLAGHVDLRRPLAKNLAWVE